MVFGEMKIRSRLSCAVNKIHAALLDDFAVLTGLTGTYKNRASRCSASIWEMNKLGLRPSFDGCVPHGIHVGWAPFPILQIDWPGWLCNRDIVRGLVRNVELERALWSVAAKDGLIAHRFQQHACE